MTLDLASIPTLVHFTDMFLGTFVEKMDSMKIHRRLDETASDSL